jgi:predicted transcriptional regulator
MTKIKSQSHSTEKLLTEVELELMSILWRLGEGSVADVLENHPRGGELAYTSVSTILRILEQKKVLRARKEGRGHVYVPLLEKTQYESKYLQHMVNRVFDGTASSLVKQLVSSVSMSPAELDELRQIIEDAGGRK